MSTAKKMNPLIPIIVIPVAGFVLLNLAFVVTAAIRYCLFLLSNMGNNREVYYLPRLFHVITPLVLLLGSYIVLKNLKFKEIYKATFSVVPTAVLLVYTGIFLYKWPVAAYAVSGLIVAAIFFYLYKTKRHWMYYYAVSIVSVTLLYMQIRGIEF